MSINVKARLKKLLIETTHEEREQIDNFLIEAAMKMGFLVVETDSHKICDQMIDKMTDEQVRRMVIRIKKKKKKEVLIA